VTDSGESDDGRAAMGRAGMTATERAGSTARRKRQWYPPGRTRPSLEPGNRFLSTRSVRTPAILQDFRYDVTPAVRRDRQRVTAPPTDREDLKVTVHRGVRHGAPASAPSNARPGRPRRVAVAVAGLVAVVSCSSSPAQPAGSGSVSGHGSLFVAAQRAGEIDRLDAATLHRTATWSIGGDPHILAYDRTHDLLWVSAPKTGILRALNPATGKVVTTIRIFQPDGLALVPGDRTLLVTSGYYANRPGWVDFVDTATRQVTARVPVGHAPHSIQVTPDGRLAYVAVMYSADIAVIDVPSHRVVRTLPTPGVPYFVLLAGDHLFVSRMYAGQVSEFLVPAGRLLATYPLIQGLSQMAISPDGSRLYVCEKGLLYFIGFPTGNIGTAVAVIDLHTGASFTVTVPSGPDAIDLLGNQLLVTSNGPGALSAISLPSLKVTTVPTGNFPTSLAAVG